MRKLLVSAALAAALFATPAIAKEGPYLGIGLTSVHIVSSETFFRTVDPAIGLELRAGYNFGSISLEGNWLGTTHDDEAVGFSDGDFRGLSIDLKLSLSQQHDPTQIYVLAGLGSYSFEQVDLSRLNFYEFSGGGFNLGAGFEHFFNEQVAMHLRGVYRFIDYDVDINGFPAATDIDGDTFTLGAALNLHF